MSTVDDDPSVPGSWEWAVCGASVTGAQHLRRGLGCDDAYSFGVAGDFVVAAVADGAGSVTGTSAWGSYTACESVLADAMKSRFISEFKSAPVEERETFLGWLFERATRRVREQSERFGLDASRLSTTLCVALADREAAVFGQIGDGIIATEVDEHITTLLVEAKDDYANVTVFLQSEGAFDVAFRTATQLGATAFALSTDGMSYKITNVATGQAYEPFFRGSWDHVRTGVSAADFTRLLRGIEDDQTGDDKTMILAAQRWEVDDFHPSPRPLRKTQVSSAPPPPLSMPVATQQEPSTEPATAIAPNAVEVSNTPAGEEVSGVPAGYPEPDPNATPAALEVAPGGVEAPVDGPGAEMAQAPAQEKHRRRLLRRRAR